MIEYARKKNGRPPVQRRLVRVPPSRSGCDNRPSERSRALKQSGVGTENLGGVVDFGTLLRRLRVERGLSQLELAERANMSVEAISALALENDQLRALREISRLAPRTIARNTSAPTPTDAAAQNLPLNLTSFVGRETEVSEIFLSIAPRCLSCP
jgi:DNA-binding XRE family transcriptional regulator